MASSNDMPLKQSKPRDSHSACLHKVKLHCVGASCQHNHSTNTQTHTYRVLQC